MALQFFWDAFGFFKNSAVFCSFLAKVRPEKLMNTYEFIKLFLKNSSPNFHLNFIRNSHPFLRFFSMLLDSSKILLLSATF